MSEIFNNHLSRESSLYLQQHAHNPVNWYAWTDEAWEKAVAENKLVLVSIGYSSCHWCHVMEKETFEDATTAKIMNDYFVCIKVDREERPDIDQVYMTAVQLMTGAGGWPLNCFTLPDGRPIYGGTYFPRMNWQDVLLKLKDFYTDSPEKAEQYADELLGGIQQTELITVKKEHSTFSKDTLQKAVVNWKPYLDFSEGGPNRAPKFPLPGNYLFLLRYAETNSDAQLSEQVNLTLKKMAFGGIYDQVAGGFARYSTDLLWKVPHFEKMLYDNAQLISLYSSAYKLSKNDLYKEIALETIEFLLTEMSDGNGGYYSAFDADSEGEEGKYYVWTKAEIEKINFPKCGNVDGHELISDYFNLNETGHWEKNNYILLRTNTDEEVAAKYGVSINELKTFIKNSKSILRKLRDEKIPPALDKKIITSWNALQITALCNAFEAFGNEKHREEAIKCANRILSNSLNEGGILMHTDSQKNKTKSGFLEDYAFTISAFIKLYQITLDEKWLIKAKQFCNEAIKYFHDDENGFFWFTSNLDTALVARKKENTDNVIPASNSEMANALFLLGVYFDEKKYSDIALQILSAVEDSILRYPSSFSNWANLMMNFTNTFNEIVITGDHAEDFRKNISSYYLPNTLIAGSTDKKSSLSLLENRFQNGKTLVYVCSNKTCKLPVENPNEALALLKK